MVWNVHIKAFWYTNSNIYVVWNNHIKALTPVFLLQNNHFEFTTCEHKGDFVLKPVLDNYWNISGSKISLSIKEISSGQKVYLYIQYVFLTQIWFGKCK